VTENSTGAQKRGIAETLFGGIGRALSHRMYRRYWTGNAVSTVGRWIFRTTLGWLVWEMTKSAAWLGAVAFAEIFPMVLLSVFAGAVSDRMGPLRLIRAVQLGICVTSIAFTVLLLAGAINIWVVVALAIVYGSLEALSTPPRVSYVHGLVPRADLSAAIALGSAMFNASRVLGPAIAGGLLLVFDFGYVFGIATLTFIQFYIVLFFLPDDHGGGDARLSLSLLRDMWDGVVYVWNHPGIRYLMAILTAIGMLIRPFMELLPGFSAEVFGRSADGFAMLLSSIGAGAMVASLWLAHRGRTEGLTRLAATSLAMQGVALVLFTVTNVIWLAIPCLLVVGFFMLAAGVSSQTLIQNVAEARVRSRVLALFILLSWGLPAIGALIAGWLSEFFGLQLTIAVGAAATIGIWLWARAAGERLAPDLERTDEAAKPAG
jgi:MFS family permease